MDITNLEVMRGSEYSDYALSWHFKGARYHVWLSADGRYELRPELFKNPIEPRNRHEPGYFATRHLDVTVAKNAEMIEQAKAEAVAGHLFGKCDQKLADEAKQQREKAAAAHALQLVKEAGPQMLTILKAISEFWRTGDDLQPLSPGALILPEGDQTIVAAVRAAVLQAETGGAVQL